MLLGLVVALLSLTPAAGPVGADRVPPGGERTTYIVQLTVEPLAPYRGGTPLPGPGLGR